MIKPKERYTILALSHNIWQVKLIADQVMVLFGGRIARCLGGQDLDKASLVEKLVEDVF